MAVGETETHPTDEQRHPRQPLPSPRDSDSQGGDGRVGGEVCPVPAIPTLHEHQEQQIRLPVTGSPLEVPLSSQKQRG